MKSNFEALAVYDLLESKYTEVIIGFKLESGNVYASSNITIKEAKEIKQKLEKEIKSAEKLWEDLKEE